MPDQPENDEKQQIFEDDLLSYDKEAHERRQDGWQKIGRGCYRKEIGSAE